MCTAICMMTENNRPGSQEHLVATVGDLDCCRLVRCFRTPDASCPAEPDKKMPTVNSNEYMPVW